MFPSVPAASAQRTSRRLSVVSRSASRITSQRHPRSDRGQGHADYIVDYSTLLGPIPAEDVEDKDEEEPGAEEIGLLPNKATLDVEPIDVRLRRLTAYIVNRLTMGEKLKNLTSGQRQQPPSEEPLLRPTSVDIGASSLTAIVGASGSGKTTLLNAIAGRISGPNVRVSGSVTFNWRDTIPMGGLAYVRQEDDLPPSLTIRETLSYAARLRLQAPEVSHELVVSIIKELHLEGCADIALSRCSGGEKRRASIGVQLLQNPSILLLDEPTTGLDATSALSIMKSLQRSARRGRTVIAVIHSPRPEILALFDRLLVMADGGLAYAGKPSKCVAHFASLGLRPRKKHTNPAESILEFTSTDYRSTCLYEESQQRVKGLLVAWEQQAGKLSDIRRKSVAPPIPPIPKWRLILRASRCSLARTSVLVQRSLLLSWRAKAVTAGTSIGAVVLALVLGIINLQLPRDLSGIRSRQGALYGSFSILCVTFLTIDIYRLVRDFRVFDQEREDGVVGALEFVLSRRLSLLLVEDLPVAVLFSVIFYFMADLRGGAGYFATFLLFTFTSLVATRCFGLLCLSIFRDYTTASVVAGFFNSIQIFCSGFEIQREQLPVYVRWLRPLAFWSYTFAGLASNEFSANFYSCPSPGGQQDPACLPYTGKYILRILGFSENAEVSNLVVILGFALAILVAAVVVLQFRRAPPQQGGKRITDATPIVPLKDHHDAARMHSGKELAPQPVSLETCGLSIHQPGSAWRYDHFTPPIVSAVTMTCAASTLTVIIGPSGSGKSTLLKAIVQYEQDRYRTSGLVKFNGQTMTAESVRQLCAFVPQEDTGLIPSLTVRETLHYAALLRLPAQLSRAQKVDRAQRMLSRLGLLDCASLPIGGATIKGISGGQRRRVSIGVQLFREPPVLVLDEPTSGLDAATASSVVELLKSLAEDGHTVLATVHQIGADDFAKIDNVVLMGQGGRICFAGQRSSMLPYFEPLGYYCRKSQSPADFVSDLLNGEYRWKRKPEGMSASEVDPSARVAELAVTWSRSSLWFNSSSTTHGQSRTNTITTVHRPNSFLTTTRILLARSLKNHARTTDAPTARIAPAIVTGLLQALFFAPLRNDQAAVQTHIGFVFVVVALCEVGLLASTAVFPAERDVFASELAGAGASSTSVEAFLLQYMALEIPCQAVSAACFSVLGVFAVGLPRTGGVYAAMVYVMFLLFSSGESLGIMFFSLFRENELALIVANVGLIAVEYMGGLLTPDLPGFLRTMNQASPIYQATSCLFPTIMRGLEFTCTAEQQLSDGQCVYGTGEDVLDMLHLDHSPVRGIYGLFLVTLGLRIAAYVALKLRFSPLRERIKRLPYSLRMLTKSRSVGEQYELP